MKFIVTVAFYVFCIITSTANPYNGILIDARSKERIPYANVFLNGTNQACLSDEKGYFTLSVNRFPCQIVVSHAAYKPQVVYLNFSPSTTDTLYLQARDIVMKEVVVEGKNQRKANAKEFSRWFLGTDNWGSAAKILNDSVLVFRRNQGVFSVSASAPLIIDQPLLGYKITCELLEFKIWKDNQYKASRCSYLGYYFFEPYQENWLNKSVFSRNRKEAYYNSSVHFCRSLHRNRLAKNGYMLVKHTKPNASDTLKMRPIARIDIDSISIVNTDSSRSFINQQDSSYTILYFGKSGSNIPIDLTIYKPSVNESSGIYFRNERSTVTSDGSIEDNNLIFSGSISQKRVGAMLPEDYWPER